MAISNLSDGAAAVLAAVPPAFLPGTPSGVLVLGDFVFQSYEIPGKISWGDQQKNHIFSYPGGPRAIEALGPEPLPVSWSGRFQGTAAAGRARRLDILCRLGGTLALSWGELSFLVLISRFEVHQERNWQLPYSIECLVVSAPIGLPGDPGAANPAASILGDAVSALGLTTGIGNPGLTTALTAVQQAAAAVQDTVSEAAGVAGTLMVPVAQLQSALGAAAGLAGTLAVAADGGIRAAAGGLAGVVPGAMGNANATALLATLSAVEQASVSRLVQGLVGRMTGNSQGVMS